MAKKGTQWAGVARRDWSESSRMRSSGLDWKEYCARKPGKLGIMVARTVFALPICVPTDFYTE